MNDLDDPNQSAERKYLVAQADVSFQLLQEALKAQDDESRQRYLKLAALTHPGGRPPRSDIVTIAEYDEGREFAQTFHAPDYADIALHSGQTISKLGYDYACLHDAAVTRRGHVVHDGRMITDIVQSENPFWRDGNVHYWFYVERPFAGYDPKTRRALVDVPKRRRRQRAFVFATANASVNFGHFLHDLLIQVPIFRRIEAEHGKLLCLFAEGFRYPMQWTLFQDVFAAEIAENRVMIGDIDGVYDQIFLAYSQFSPLDGINYDAARELRAMIQDVASRKKSDTRFAPKLYVNRRDGLSDAYGRLRTGDPHERTFNEAGFQSLTISDMTPDDVFAAFDGAEVVAGIHGAGLLNALFSRHQQCRLIEIHPAEAGWNSIERLAKASGLAHVAAHGDVDVDQIVSLIQG